MDRTLNQLIQNFSNQNLLRFFERRNSRTAEKNQDFPHLSMEGFGTPRYICRISFPPVSHLDVWSIPVQEDLSFRSGKKKQYDFAIQILKQINAFNGIFVFYDSAGNFRFSFIYRVPEGPRVRSSNYRRFTYFVSPQLTNKTFISRFSNETFSKLEDIHHAFSVEPVSTQFFNQFREVFQKTKNEFEKLNKNTVCLRLKAKYEEKEEYDEQINKFVFTFLGRIIFLYFMLRKGWVENRPNFIRAIREDESFSNLYQNLFEPLFFEVFAKDKPNRLPEIQERFPNTPYLNGGLFERSELERDARDNNILILFSDNFIRKDIIDFFESYNFTVDENSADDQEVSIDPEMLGKVFENSLAELQRKRSGTFYTPREIVHYMVLESIQQYLSNETDISHTKIHDFVFHPDNTTDALSVQEIRLLDAKLQSVKVLDPAVGSGAFPVEFLNTLVKMRKKLNVAVGSNVNEVSIKKAFIKENLYGVDIDPGAIEITKLRLWLSLIVDYDITETEPLPSLDFQFRVGNSLMEKIAGIDVFSATALQTTYLDEKDGGDSRIDQIKTQMLAIKDQFYSSSDEEQRHVLKKSFDQLERVMIETVIHKHESIQLNLISTTKARRSRAQERLIASNQKQLEKLRHKLETGTYKLFKPDFHFSEVYDRRLADGSSANGFDIVIGNPPYGVRIEREIYQEHGLGSSDSYGVFISTALKRFLKPNGVLVFIISDTWLSIKTHLQLRQQVLDNSVHKIILLNSDCFNATVNVNILSLTKYPVSSANQLLAADLSNISTRDQIDELHSLLYHLENHIGVSEDDYAVYQYPQSLIQINSNLPVFVGCPKLFRLTQDLACRVEERQIAGKRVPVRFIDFNGKELEIVRFGDVADVRQGLATADNWTYLFQNPSARGTYTNIELFKAFLLSEEELEYISENDPLREKIISHGFHKGLDETPFDPDRWFGGRYIVPYDKGGESDINAGWLPNYYVPTDYYIDWSSWAVHRLRTLTEFDRDGKGSKSSVLSRFQNVDYYFTKGFTLSYTGIYAPNLRLNSIGVFDVGGSSVFSELQAQNILGKFTSKLNKYFAKVYIDQTVNFQVDENKALPFILEESDRIKELVDSIIEKQHKDPRYPYHLYEQKEINQIVYELFNLNEEDIREVETWYRRRYPALRDHH